ncbi:MAG: ATP-binding protein [Bacteriovorax sp.]|nr:ATP-binding protein [Bacteriovorax sp.]
MPYIRQLHLPNKSFFLFGPRGTGKSTWLRDIFKPDLTIDLLRSDQFLELSANPSSLREKLEALKPHSKVVIDEIQKLPILLDEIHSYIFESNHNLQFALTGSSARKLKKSNANLLAGRAINKKMFSLNSHEIGADFNIDQILRFGTLPSVMNLKKENEKIEYLMTYVENYLKEEIQAEAAVRNLSSYHRFLKHAAIMNAQVLNVNNISKEASVARSTLDGYFNIIEETLLGSFVEAIHLKAKVKEVSTPKFYFFDCGVVRALRNELGEKITDTEKGYLLETFILNEIQSYSSYHQKYAEVYYWGTPSQNEVDFIISKGPINIGLEIKSSKKWKKEFNSGISVLLESKKIKKAIAVYLGPDRLKSEQIDVYPLKEFLSELHSGNIF